MFFFNIFENLQYNKIMGMLRFRQENETLSVSVCVAQIYIKSWKKINADSDNVGASNLALAA